MAGFRRAAQAAILLAVATRLVAGAGPATGGADVRLARPVRPVGWGDFPPPIQQRLRAGGLSESALPAFLDRLRTETDRRLRDGNFDHLVYYALQSTHISTLPPIEPALSARTFVEDLHRATIPADAAARLDALATALVADAGDADHTGAASVKGVNDSVASGARGSPREDARLALFREIALAGAAAPRERLREEYVRAMGFLYEKEFVAARAANGREATAALYQTRSHSTDTQIEAGYAVSVALATLKALDPTRRIERVLIIGPGLDLAPRTGLLESAAPQSYQPFAVADALIALGLSARPSDTTRPAHGEGVQIDLADINPLVVRHFERLATATQPVRLDIVSGLPDDERTRLSEDYRGYVQQWGRAIATATAVPGPALAAVPVAATAAATAEASGPSSVGIAAQRVGSPHLQRIVLVDPAIARAMRAVRFNVISDRFTDARQYDLIVITNVLPYFADDELMMALANIASLLAPGGALVHNEPRPALLAAAAAIGLPAVQARTVLLASPVGGQPLHDTILLNLNRKD